MVKRIYNGKHFIGYSQQIVKSKDGTKGGYIQGSKEIIGKWIEVTNLYKKKDLSLCLMPGSQIISMPSRWLGDRVELKVISNERKLKI